MRVKLFIFLGALLIGGAAIGVGLVDASAQPPTVVKIKVPEAHDNPLPAPYTGLDTLLTQYRGAAPKLVTEPSGSDMVKVTDAKGTYMLSDHAMSYNGTDSGQSVVSVVVGTKLTTWIVDSTTDAIIQGPIKLSGKETTIRPKAKTAADVAAGVCLIYAYAPWLDTAAVKIFGYDFAEAYSLIVCTPAMNIIMGQQLYQQDLNTFWYPIQGQHVSGEVDTTYWDGVILGTCLYGTGGGTWGWKDYTTAYVVWPGVGTGKGNDMSAHSQLYCNAL